MPTKSYELKWLKRLILSLGVINESPTYLNCDSQTTLHIAANPIYYKRIKHIEINCRFIQDEIQQRNIAISNVRTYEQLANLLARGLSIH